MKIIITESQLNKLIKEDRNIKIKRGEEWFYEPKNYCLRNHKPQLDLSGESATHNFSDGVGYIAYSKDGSFFLNPKPRNPDAIPYNMAFEQRTGWWSCNKSTGKIDIKVDNEATRRRIAVFNGEPVDIKPEDKSEGHNIPQAKTMDDVKNGKGFIILKMQGEHVRELQSNLMDLGYDLGPKKNDGIFGKFTKDAVEKFQKDNDIKPKNGTYGVFGRITYNKLMDKLKNK